MLTALGATKEEDCVYQHIVTTLSATVDEIGAATGLPDTSVRAALAGLAERGLAGRTADAPERYVAASPAVIEALISERHVELRSARDTLEDLASRYHATQHSGVFEVLRGRDALRQCTVSLLRSARVEVLNLVKPPITALQSEERVVPEGDVPGRIIFETETLAASGAYEAIQQNLRAPDEIRVHTKLPIKMLAVDRSIALLPISHSDTTPLGVVLRAGAVLDAMLALFDYVWATAIPLHVDNANSRAPATGSVLSAEDRRLLSILLSGLTDDAIAAHTGVSVRTIQRRVQALMAMANVRTRMQLAWEASRQGWV